MRNHRLIIPPTFLSGDRHPPPDLLLVYSCLNHPGRTFCDEMSVEYGIKGGVTLKKKTKHSCDKEGEHENITEKLHLYYWPHVYICVCSWALVCMSPLYKCLSSQVYYVTVKLSREAVGGSVGWHVTGFRILTVFWVTHVCVISKNLHRDTLFKFFFGQTDDRGVTQPLFWNTENSWWWFKSWFSTVLHRLS